MSISSRNNWKQCGYPNLLCKGVIVLALLLAGVFPSYAQTGEVGLTFHYSRLHAFNRGGNVNIGGTQLEGNYNLNRWLAISSEFTYFQHCEKVCDNLYFDLARDRTILALVGPRFVLPSIGRKTPFIHLRAGVADSNSTDDITGFRRSSTGLGLAAGGGLDLDYGRFAMRAFQADFLRTHAKGSPQNTFRAGAGVAVRIGKLRERK